MTALRRLQGSLGLLLALLPGISAASSPPLPAQWDSARYMDVSEIRPGMKGIGRSVFLGTEIREFGVEILGVLPTADPRTRMILGRLSGEGLETSGVIAGMSGSPIYVDGRLIGALAFGWPYSVEPITGITPIADMLALGDRGAAAADEPADARQSPALWQALWHADSRQAMALLSEGTGAPDSGLPALRVPVAMSGLGGAARGEAARILEGQGLLLEEGAALGFDPSLAAGPLEPGSVLAVELVRGDAQIAAIGTVTWTDGNQVLAFGHPMMNRGAASYPMSAARIVTVMPRLSSSFKMGVVGAPVGAVTRDYSKGIMGTVGTSPRMIPMNVDLHFGGREERLRFEILEAQALTPALAGVVVANAVETLGREVGASTVTVTTRIALEDGRSLETRQVDANFSPSMSLAGDVARLVALVHGNPFEAVTVHDIAVTATVDDTLHAAFLESLVLPPGPYRSGSTLSVDAELRDYRGHRWTHRIAFRLPAGLAPGTYTLLACDGQQDGAAEVVRVPGRFEPQDLDQMLALLADETPRDTLVLRLLGAGGDPVVAGRELPGLPPSMRRALVAPLAGGRVTQTGASVEHVQLERMGRMVIGCQGVPMTVEPAR